MRKLISRVKNPSDVALGVGIGVGVLAVGGLIFWYWRDQERARLQSISEPVRTPATTSVPQIPQTPSTTGTGISSYTEQFKGGPVGGAQSVPSAQTPNPSAQSGSSARRNQSFHLRSSDTASNANSVNVRDNPRLELLQRGTSVRNPNEVMWQVRIMEGQYAGRIGWTFILPNEIL